MSNITINEEVNTIPLNELKFGEVGVMLGGGNAFAGSIVFRNVGDLSVNQYPFTVIVNSDDGFKAFSLTKNCGEHVRLLSNGSSVRIVI